jgi:general secretion pathway protein F
MPTFAYRARNRDGQVTSGTLVAETTLAAARQLDERNLLPTELTEIGSGQRSVLTGRSQRISLATIGTTYEQLADLLKAGVPILRSLHVLASQASSPALSRVLREVHDDVAGGDSRADALEKHPDAVPPLHASMVRAGEKGGFLEDVLHRLADFVTRADTLKKKFIGSLIYPMILVFAGIGAVLLILLYVVPKLRPFLESRPDLPSITKFVFFANDVLTLHYGKLLIVITLLVAGVWAYLRSESGKLLIARLSLKAPVFGEIYSMVAICRFFRIFGTLLANGIPIIQALQTSKDSAGNILLTEAIGEAADAVSHGEPLAAPLGKSKLFPPAILDMVSVAEESNTLEKVLVDIANTQEERTGRQIELFVRMLEPLLLVCMGAAVMLIAVALLLPILKISTGGMR